MWLPGAWLLLLQFWLTQSYVARTLPRFVVRNLSAGRLHRIGTHLASKLRWEIVNDNDHRDNAESKTPSITQLTGIDNPVQIDVDTLVQRWIEQNLSLGGAADKNAFSLKSAVPLAMSPDRAVELVNKTLEREQTIGNSITYISDEELQKIWRWNLYKPLEKPRERYDPRDAFMLLDDEDMRVLMGPSIDDDMDSDVAEETVVSEQVTLAFSFRCRTLYGPNRPLLCPCRNWRGYGRSVRRSNGVCPRHHTTRKQRSCCWTRIPPTRLVARKRTGHLRHTS
jgi:hypothetical protein